MLRVCLLSFAILTCARANEDISAAPQAMDPVVVASEGGSATLHCLSHVYPLQKITWMFEGRTINGNAWRYRLKSDSTLEIYPLYRDDTGIYICLVHNYIGEYMRKIRVHLVVNVLEQDCNQFREEYEHALECKYGVKTSTQDGCQRTKCIEDPCVKANCSSSDHCEIVELNSTSPHGDLYFARCVPVLEQDCNQFREEYEHALECKYGVKTSTQDGCQRWKCIEDPCVKANCSSSDHCEIVELNSTSPHGDLYFARCVPVQNCNQFRGEYEHALECYYGMHTSTQDGCQRWKCIENPCFKANCSSSEHCVTVELNSTSPHGDLYFARCDTGDVCEPFKKKCNELNKCSFGIQKINGTDGCERCKCKLDPCKKKSCPAGRRCVVQTYTLLIVPDSLFSAICGTMVKAGACPTEDTSPYKKLCTRECKDDADCRGVGKCCKRGCSRLCLLPVEQTSTYPLLSSACSRPTPCSTSTHGCCQDGKTPAHGPEFEGCCLLEAYGCCPDNRKPAEGPRLEGCGCQYTLHGCCPDNVTVAQGPDNQGCGCQYTQHGCCPDRHTAASGPHNEGCTCNTYQFGCCGDGVTTAKGPDQQGCHCRESKFGCCGDGETHATGPGAVGCDCSSSHHGCCPDGRTEATGAKFLGCTDAPKIKQAVCSMPTDQGPCHNFTAMWYYDLAYGGCSSFRYGGCDGNGNRFLTKEDCEAVCVKPSPEDVCKLPSVKGACVAQYQRWHYNSTQEQCTPFIYGGCLGNANNFETRELCQKQCEPSSVLGQCSLPIDQGSCVGNYSRWAFNSKVYRCEQFIWGGCEGNSNRFSHEAVCQMHCAGTQSSQCTQPQKAGNCAEKEARWSFSQSENRCLPFYYSGCGGNDNRFRSRETCERTCPSTYVRDKCTLPAEPSHCYTVDVYRRYTVRFFYDTTSQRCRKFSYSGCGGNENNFVTEAECWNSCLEIKTNITTSAPTTADICSDAIDAGPCNNTETRYAYDSELGRCVAFQYGGCGGTNNNFKNKAYCSYNCEPKQDICKLLNLQGSCEESLMRWFYDHNTDSWTLTYGGCEGNGNSEQCKNGSAPVEPTTTTPTVIADGPSECRVPEALEDCRYGGEVWYFDSSRHECLSHANQKAGLVCRYNGTFLSQEACEQSCGVFRGVDPVRMAIGISEDSKAEITGELGSPLMLNCRPYGDQLRYYMSWYRGFEGNSWLFNNTVYEPRGNVLLIRNLTIDTLGRYTCQAIYEKGQTASRGLVVQAYMPKEPFMNSKWLVPRDALAARPGIHPPSTTTTIESPRPLSTGTVLRYPLAHRPETQPTTTTITTTTKAPKPKRIPLRRFCSRSCMPVSSTPRRRS